MWTVNAFIGQFPLHEPAHAPRQKKQNPRRRAPAGVNGFIMPVISRSQRECESPYNNGKQADSHAAD